jgi:hypothetical protein
MDTAKLFKNGRSQAVRLPKEYILPIRIGGQHIYFSGEKQGHCTFWFELPITSGKAQHKGR